LSHYPKISHKTSPLSEYLNKVLIFALVFCVVSIIVTALWTTAVSKTHRFVYRLAPENGVVTGEMVREAARILRARLEQFKREFSLHGCRVQATAANELRVEFRTRFDTQEFQRWLTMQGLARFHLLHPDGDILIKTGYEALPDGYVLKTYRETRYSLSRPGALRTRLYHYAVQASGDMAVSRFSKVRLETVGFHKKTVLTFELPREDAEALRRLTALNVGRKMAMLIDGELFFPPKAIGSPIPEGRVQVIGYFYNPPLRRLVKVLSAGTLPCTLVEVSHDLL